MEASSAKEFTLRAPMLNDHRVLILNGSFEALRIVNWQRAMVLCLAKKAEVLSYYDVQVHSVSQSFELPSVMRIVKFVKYRRNSVRARFSRQHVFMRDDFHCQYCSKNFNTKELTMDHVIPVVKGGKTSWSNIVTCCVACNQKKGSKTLQEANLILKRYPKEPLPGFLPDLLYYRAAVPESWKSYLPQNHIKFFESLLG